MKLDGDCSETVQLQINLTKKRLSLVERGLTELQSDFVVRAVDSAVRYQRLVAKHVSIRYCKLCDKSGGYFLHTRSGKYHRKGQPNLDRPIHFFGYDLGECTSCQGYASLGCCSKCFDQIRQTLAEALEGVRAEISELITGYPPKFRREQKQACLACGWQGLSSQLLGRLQKCPSCGKSTELSGKVVIKQIPEFEVTDASQAT